MYNIRQMATVVECCHTCKQNSSQLLTCARCKSVKYCSRECQRVDWSGHKPNCSADLKENAQIAMESTRAIFSNRNFVAVTQSLTHYWNLEGKGHIHCVITPDSGNTCKPADTERFFECTLEYREGIVEEHPGALGMNILFIQNPSPSGIFRSTVGFIPRMCAEAFTRTSNRVKFAALAGKQLKVMTSDLDFCSFMIGETLYTL